MTAYWITTYKAVHDPDKVAAYATLAGPALTAAGGRFLVRGVPGGDLREGRVHPHDRDRVPVGRGGRRCARQRGLPGSARCARRRRRPRHARGARRVATLPDPCHPPLCSLPTAWHGGGMDAFRLVATVIVMVGSSWPSCLSSDAGPSRSGGTPRGWRRAAPRRRPTTRTAGLRCRRDRLPAGVVLPPQGGDRRLVALRSREVLDLCRGGAGMETNVDRRPRPGCSVSPAEPGSARPRNDPRTYPDQEVTGLALHDMRRELRISSGSFISGMSSK